MFERELRELSFVPRWPIVRRIREQSVAEHSYYVALYAGQVADMLDWRGNRAELLDHALRHDLDEVFMSDIPGPSKRAIKDDNKADTFIRDQLELRFGREYFVRTSLDPAILMIIKVADLLDEVFFLTTEQQLGNRAVSVVLEHSFERLLKRWHTLCDLVNAPPSVRSKGAATFEIAFDHHNKKQSIIVTG